MNPTTPNQDKATARPWATDIAVETFDGTVLDANVFKSPSNPLALQLPENTITVFKWDDEFTAHHTV